MATELIIKRAAGGLIPADAISAEALSELPQGKELKAKVTVARSNPQNRWFHKVLMELFKMQETWPTYNLFRDAVKRALGYADEYVIDGKLYYETRSIAFAKMDQTEFNQFVDRFVKLVCERILPNFTEAETREMLALLDATTNAMEKTG